MSDYRRSREGRLFFFTVVTHHRRPILTSDSARTCLRRAISEVREDRPFHVTAAVLLPDHLHAIWELPRDDIDYSTRWRRIKGLFTRYWLDAGGSQAVISRSRAHRQERGVWQRRFFEHTIRDERDFRRCFDYLHVNPVKHRLVERVQDWPWSSFHKYVRSGHYPADWGGGDAWYGDEFTHFE